MAFALTVGHRWQHQRMGQTHRVTAAEGAAVLGVSVNTIYSWRHRGLIDPAEQPPRGRRTLRGGYRLYDLDDLRAVHARVRRHAGPA